MRISRLLAATVFTLGCATFGPATAQDSMGGFDKAYTNRGNAFGHGLWGNGRGTALPVPDRGSDFGFYYGQPYDGGATLFGTGFWAAEAIARQAERGGDRDRRHERLGDRDFGHGPLGDKVAGKGDHKPPKDDHGGHKPPKHEHKPYDKEKVRYVPYGRTETFLVPRRSTTVVVIQEKRTEELGQLHVTTARRSETFSAICLDGKGNEHLAILSTGDSDDDAYAGEVFRCEGDQMLRVSYDSGAADIVGSVRTGDGTSYKDCDSGDALIRTGSGELVCAAKRPMSRAAERELAREYGGYDAEIAGGYDDGAGYGPGGDVVDLTGLELTGGIGN
ncbi:MAG: hypothetical protein IT548_16415 [Alphaproteobacteria bacterium]|nr:hypothetical protein [Alphaproteobacteria bacterium]